MLDMFDTLPAKARDDKLALKYVMNKENYMAISSAADMEIVGGTGGMPPEPYTQE